MLLLVSPRRLVSNRHLALLLFVSLSSCLTCRFDTWLARLTSFFCSPRLVRKCRFDTRLTRLVCPFPRAPRVEFDGSLTSGRTRDPRVPRHVRHVPPPRELRWRCSRGSRATPLLHVPCVTALASSGAPAHVAHVRHVPLLASSGAPAHVAHVRLFGLFEKETPPPPPPSFGNRDHVRQASLAHVRHLLASFSVLNLQETPPVHSTQSGSHEADARRVARRRASSSPQRRRATQLLPMVASGMDLVDTDLVQLPCSL